MLNTKNSADNNEIGLLQAHLKTLINSFEINYWWKDIEGIYRGCNEKVAKLLGLSSADDIVGKTDHDLSWKESAGILIKNDNWVIANKKSITSEETVVDTYGKVLIFQVTKAPLLDDDENVIGTIGTSINITQQKRAEILEKESVELAQKAQDEQELREAVMVLTGSIVHDLRAPLTSTKILCANLERDLFALTTSNMRATNILLKEDYPTILNSIVDDMSECISHSLKMLSKSLVHDLKKEDLLLCSIRKCLIHTLKYCFLAENDKKLITHNISDDFYFMGNEILMIRVLTNLIKNALEQVQQQQIGTVSIFCEEREGHYHLHVKDTAGGVSKENISMLFSGYKTSKKEGTGIGLAFCQKVVNYFGGTIRADSVEGKYMDIILTLPRAC